MVKNFYIKIETMEWPRFEGDIRLEHPEITEEQTGNTFPCPQTYGLVEYIDKPTDELGTYEYYDMDTPIPPGHPSNTSANNNWQIVWTKKTMTDEEIEKINQTIQQNLEARRQAKANTANTPG